VQTSSGLLIDQIPQGGVELASTTYGALFLFLGGLTLGALLVYRNARDVDAAPRQRGTGSQETAPAAAAPRP
jgi:hypothetical protein